MYKTKEEIEALAKNYAEIECSAYTNDYNGYLTGYTACQEEDKSQPIEDEPVVEKGYSMIVLMWHPANNMWFQQSFNRDPVTGTIYIEYHKSAVGYATRWQPLPNPPKV